MPMTWNDKADVRLFVHVLKIHSVKIDYAALAKAMGPGVTAKAISHRIGKLRSIAAGEEDNPTSSGGPNTPRKERGKAAAAKKRGHQDMQAQDDDEDLGNGAFKEEDDEAEERGTKKVKIEPETSSDSKEEAGSSDSEDATLVE